MPYCRGVQARSIVLRAIRANALWLAACVGALITAGILLLGHGPISPGPFRGSQLMPAIRHSAAHPGVMTGPGPPYLSQ
jgi:hypothetical protein